MSHSTLLNYVSIHLKEFFLRIITFNANGIRSATKKGVFGWLSKQNADIICVQETKSHVDAESDPLIFPKEYQAYFNHAEKRGYSGVALYTRHTPDRIHRGLGWKEADSEGRYIQADFGQLSVASIYLPSGTSGEVRQNVKFDFLKNYRDYLNNQKKDGREYILAGDWNIAHKNIDLKNWRSNQKNSGFLPEERAWLDELFSSNGFVDAFRVFNQEPDQYTWWTQRSPTAWANNIGWRIDYHVVTPGIANKVKFAEIYRGQKFSDHAPLIIDYDWEL